MPGAQKIIVASRTREPSSSVRRRAALLAALSMAFVLTLHGAARGESPTAPIPIQARIVARILPFERGFAARSPASILILVLERSGNADSGSAARQIEKALSDVGTISGKPIRIETVAYTNAQTFAEQCRKRGAVVAYITPGFGQEMKAIAGSLQGSEVLSVAAVETYVADGAVLGVEVSSGKPRMSINLTQARAQKLDFPSALLSLAKVYR